MRFKFKDEFVGSNFFMNYLLNNNVSLKKIRSIATGTTSVAAIYTKDLLLLKLTLPSNTLEQQKIAACLSSLDDLITAQTKKIETLKQHKKGLMQQLFPSIKE
jgi:type I restriction enzyme S subunit